MDATHPPAEPRYEVVWPCSPNATTQRPLARRLNTLDGARIAFAWDFLFRGDELFPVLAVELRRRFPTVEIIDYTVLGNTHGGDEAAVIAALPHVLAEHRVDAVVSGNGC